MTNEEPVNFMQIVVRPCYDEKQKPTGRYIGEIYVKGERIFCSSYDYDNQNTTYKAMINHIKSNFNILKL